MDIDKLIAQEIPELNQSTRYYEKMLREAHLKYASLDSYTLLNHARRIETEARYFGSSFRTVAGLVVIKNLLQERATS